MVVVHKLYVYVMESEAGPQKVGHSGDPQNRLLQLMTGHPFGLEVVYTRHHEQAPLLENIAHRLLDNCKIAGRREWFKCSREAAIYAVDAAFDVLELMEKPLSRKISSRSGGDNARRLPFLGSLGVPDEDKGPGANVRIWLRRELSCGTKWRRDIVVTAAEMGLDERAVDRAANRIGVVRGGPGGGAGVTWTLPALRKKRRLDKPAVAE